MTKPRILTGIRPTGPLHLGHYVGALKKWKELQDTGKYECFFLLADAQALTDHAGEPGKIRRAILDVTLDWLSTGLNPQRSAFVVQSQIPEIFELEHYLASITPQAWVEDNPTLKDEIRILREERKETVTSAFARYPVSQAADILIVKANLVPVGEDQIPHIELTRKIARRFNQTFGLIFPIPEYMVGEVGRLIGTDGSEKMSKSLDNVIFLSDPKKIVQEKVMQMFTDPKRVRADIPGTIEGNPVFIYHDAFNPNKEEVADLKELYRQGRIGDVAVKEKLILVLENFLEPIQERRHQFEKNLDELRSYLAEGTKREKEIAQEVSAEVKQSMGITLTEG